MNKKHIWSGMILVLIVVSLGLTLTAMNLQEDIKHLSSLNDSQTTRIEAMNKAVEDLKAQVSEKDVSLVDLSLKMSQAEARLMALLSHQALNEQVTKLTAQATDSLDFDDMQVLRQTPFDLDHDGKEENIVLMARVERDPNGQLAWDDGQVWALVVSHGDQSIVLFNDYVQLGVLEVFPYELETDGVITYGFMTQQQSSAGVLITTYLYDSQAQVYYKTPIYQGIYPIGLWPMVGPFE